MFALNITLTENGIYAQTADRTVIFALIKALISYKSSRNFLFFLDKKQITTTPINNP
jgi:hypothetical protein